MRRYALLATTVLVLSACGEDKAAKPELVATDVSALRVTGEQEQVKAFVAFLSPDGKKLLYRSNKSGTCVRGVDGSNEHCLDKSFFDIGSAAWSPDGGRLALTEEHVLGLEPDVWVLDVGSGDLKNLTDDRVDAGTISLADAEIRDGAAMDEYPSWSADGQQVRFIRRESADAIMLMSVPAGGGEPKQLRSIATNWVRLQTVAWSKDHVAWLSGSSDGDDGEVLAVGDKGEPRKVLDGRYTILSFSSDGEFLLADRYGKDGAASEGTARVVPVRGGDPIAVAAGRVTYPTWAPKGHAIAYVEPPGTLRVVGKPGGEPRDLHQESQLSAADHGNLDWVPGRLLVMRGKDNPVVLSITE